MRDWRRNGRTKRLLPRRGRPKKTPDGKVHTLDDIIPTTADDSIFAATRDQRVEGWRNFQSTGPVKKKKKGKVEVLG